MVPGAGRADVGGEDHGVEGGETEETGQNLGHPVLTCQLMPNPLAPTVSAYASGAVFCTLDQSMWSLLPSCLSRVAQA